MAEPTIPFEQLRSLLEMFREAKTRADERAKVTHERFNVFTTLLEAHDEVRLHTRFLHCLLNPEGPHDCGRVFLDLFFATLKERPCLDNEDKDIELSIDSLHPEKSWTVENEVTHAGVGRIDILLMHPEFGIALENKINACEQDFQIKRYADFLSGKFAANSLVIYLTCSGEKSNTHAGKRYMRISYADHILTWLEKCLCKTYHIILINQVLLQYRAVVLELTGKNLESKSMKEISEFIKQNPDIIYYRKQLDEAIKVTRADFLDRLAGEIIKELELDGKFSVRRRSNLVQERFGVDPNGALIITPQQDSPLRHASFEIWVEHIAKSEDALVVGIESKYEKPPLSAEDKSLLEKMNLILKKDKEHHKADPASTWNQTYWPTGWHDLIYPFNDEELAGRLKLPFSKTVSEVCQKILIHIKLLEQTYTEAKQLTNS